MTGRATLPLSILISAACWVLGGALGRSSVGSVRAEGHPIWSYFDELGIGEGWNVLCGFLLYVLSGYLLVLFNNAYAIIRMRASTQTALFLLLVSACSGVHQRLHVGCLLVLLLLASLHFLFHSYQRRRPEADLTHTFLFIGLGSLLFPQLTWLAPVFWVGAWTFQSLTFRSFLASLVGWSIPFLLLLIYAYSFGCMEVFLQPFHEMVRLRPLAFSLRPGTLVTLGFTFILLLGSTLHCILSGLEDNIRTRCYLHFFILLSLALLAYVALQPVQGVLLLPLLFIGVSFLAAHLFVLTDSRWSNAFFILVLVLLVAVFVCNLWEFGVRIP